MAAIAASGGDARGRLAAAVDAFFTASSEPSYVRIVLRDAPLVLDRLQGRQLDHAIGLGLVIDLIAGLRAEGLVSALPITMTARIFLAAVSEVAMSMAHADDAQAVRRDGLAVIAALIEGLRLAAAVDPAAADPG